MANPRICPACGRAMEKDDEGNMWVCVCGNEEKIWYGRNEENY